MVSGNRVYTDTDFLPLLRCIAVVSKHGHGYFSVHAKGTKDNLSAVQEQSVKGCVIPLCEQLRGPRRDIAGGQRMKRLELVELRRIGLASEVGQNRGELLRRPKIMRIVDPSIPSTGRIATSGSAE